MSAASPTPPVLPPASDWLAQTLLEMNGTLGAVDERTKQHGARLAALATKVELRAVRLMVSGLYGLVILGFTALGWLVTRR